MQIKTAGDIGRLIREARVNRGLSQKALASRFGSNQSWISEIENGKETAEIGMVLKILAYLELNLDLSDGRAQRLDRLSAEQNHGFDDFPDIDEIVDGEAFRS